MTNNLTQTTQVERGNTKTLSTGFLIKKRCRKWCFTLNNYTTQDISNLISIFKDKKIKYIFGEEIAPSTNTIHLQGYLEFLNPVVFETIKNYLPKAHIECSKGSLIDNFNYCSKDNKFYTNFVLPRKNNILSREQIINYPYQNFVFNTINNDIPDNRSIYWFYDPNGNMGKTVFIKTILDLNPNDSIFFSGGKVDDITSQVLLMDNPINICLFNFARSNNGKISYNAIEQLKDGLVNSPKYKGGFKSFAPPHVFIFANFFPKIKSLSLDRWKIYKINPDKSFDEEVKCAVCELPFKDCIC